MSKTRNSRTVEPRLPSAVDPGMLARYRRAARAPDLRDEIRTMMVLVGDYQALMAAGDLTHALGAGLELVDIGLRIAATPSLTSEQLQYKVGFFQRHFGSMTGSFDHGHVASIADAAVAAERALAADHPQARQ